MRRRNGEEGEKEEEDEAGGRGAEREREARERLLLGGVVAGYVCCVRPRGCINHFPDLRGEYIPRFIPDIRAGTFALNRII